MDFQLYNHQTLSSTTSSSPPSKRACHPTATMDWSYTQDPWTTVPDYTFSCYPDTQTQVVCNDPYSTDAISPWPLYGFDSNTTATLTPPHSMNATAYPSPDLSSTASDSSFQSIYSNHNTREHLSPFTSSQNTPLPSPHIQPTRQPIRRSSPAPIVRRDASLKNQPVPEPPKRKRGRPRLVRSTSSSDQNIYAPHTITPTANTTTNRRSLQPTQPHTEVERRYRERLNAELERLRSILPTLHQGDGEVIGSARPSKTMVLAVAIDYIRDLERERDAAIAEVERLGGSVKVRVF